MSVASDAVALFRSYWADRFVDTVQILRYSTGGSFNATTLQYDGGSETVVYSGDALIRPSSGQETDEETQELRTFLRYDVYLPYTAAGISVEDRISVVLCNLDDDLTGKILRVVAVVADSYLTRRRVVAELDLGRGSGR